MPFTIINELQLFGKLFSKCLVLCLLISLTVAHTTYACGKPKHLVTKRLGGKGTTAVWSATHVNTFSWQNERCCGVP